MTKLITYNYNYYDEELIDIFIAFLKSLALQLTPETLSVFINEVSVLFVTPITESKHVPSVLSCNQIL